MGFPQNTIRLEAAKKIFEDAGITVYEVNEEPAYYEAEWNQQKFQDKSLTALCRKLWSVASQLATATHKKADAAD